MLFLVKFKQDDREFCNLYDNTRDFIRDTFCPNIEVLGAIEFKISGKNYAERKACARDLAIQYSNMDKTGLSYGEYAEIENFFDKQACRYGLYEEFRENGVL